MTAPDVAHEMVTVNEELLTPLAGENVGLAACSTTAYADVPWRRNAARSVAAARMNFRICERVGKRREYTRLALRVKERTTIDRIGVVHPSAELLSFCVVSERTTYRLRPSFLAQYKAASASAMALVGVDILEG